MKESREKAKGISLTPQPPGWGRGRPPPGPFPSFGQARAHKDSGGCRSSTVCLPLLSRPHDSTSLHNIMAVLVYHRAPQLQISNLIKNPEKCCRGIRYGQVFVGFRVVVKNGITLQIKYMRTEWSNKSDYVLF